MGAKKAKKKAQKTGGSPAMLSHKTDGPPPRDDVCTIYGIGIGADGKLQVGKTITATLINPRIGGGLPISKDGSLISSRPASTEVDAEGRWEISLLAPGELITPDCYYEFALDGRPIARTSSFEFCATPRRLTEVSEDRSPKLPFNILRASSKLYYRVTMLHADEQVGTAFFYKASSRQGGGVYLVTNRHVIENKWKFHFSLTRKSHGKPLIGETHLFEYEGSQDYWHCHEDADVDVAVMPLEPALREVTGETKPARHFYFQCVEAQSAPQADQEFDLDAVCDVLFVGYPRGELDKQNALPLVRKGLTATPYQVDFEGKPMFIVDAPVYQSSSGSPVFISPTSLNQKYVNGYQVDYVFVGVLTTWTWGDAEVGDEDRSRTTMPLNLGRVLKPRAIQETIDHLLSQEAEGKK